MSTRRDREGASGVGLNSIDGVMRRHCGFRSGVVSTIQQVWCIDTLLRAAILSTPSAHNKYNDRY